MKIPACGRQAKSEFRNPKFEMALGNLQLYHPLFLAPMSGITDYPFRRLVRETGCGLTFTGLVSAEGLIRKKESLLKIGQDDHPVSVQLFGSSPEVLAEAAAMAESMGADAIDINMGCPARQVIEAGAGVDLMRSPEKVKKILIAVRGRVNCSLTIKIRSGWDKHHINAVEISKIAEGCGVDAISLHPRTMDQGFRGRADWNLIGDVKRSVSIPVIGNGDVKTPFLAKRMIEETGCDGVMVGRGALGNPWIFSPENSDHAESRPNPTLSLKERRQVIEYHFSLLQDHYGEKKAVKEVRKHLYWYTKALPFSASFHSKLSTLKEKEAMFEAVRSYFDFVERRNECLSSESAKSESATG